jgi:hypothetical protein
VSAHRLRARLNRLASSGGTAVAQNACDFAIDAALAKALRDDQRHLSELIRKRPSGQHDGPVSAAEVEEEFRLLASIADRARAIGCPVGYGPRQALNDSSRLHQLHCKRLTPPSCGGGTLTGAEDTEEAQLMARVAAYDESPEGRARCRIFVLQLQGFAGGRSTAEQNELDSLRTLYPDLPLDPNDPLNEAFEACAAAARQA